MTSQEYISNIEVNFQKTEYISIKKLSVKMLSHPVRHSQFNDRVFCFVVNNEKPSKKLIDELTEYAKSVSFYTDPQKKEKILVLPIFVNNTLTDSSKDLISSKAKKNGQAFVFSSAFELNSDTLTLSNVPFLNGDTFKKILSYAKTIFALQSSQNGGTK